MCLSQSRAGAVVGHVGSDVQHIQYAFEWSGVGANDMGQPHRPSVDVAIVGEARESEGAG